MTTEQRALYERNRRQIERGFKGFETIAEDGSLLGPWGVFIHEPSVGQAHYDVIDAITELGRLPETAKQVALLTVGAHYKAAYELYAHATVAAEQGLDSTKIAIICAAQRPPQLAPDEACAYDVTSALLHGGVLAGATYANAVQQFGRAGFNELILWIGTYATVSLTLNAFDVPSEQFG
jgi:4-carboxymuconolactone decarboxylase